MSSSAGMNRVENCMVNFAVMPFVNLVNSLFQIFIGGALEIEYSVF